jgi:hypothetical protein
MAAALVTWPGLESGFQHVECQFVYKGTFPQLPNPPFPFLALIRILDGASIHSQSPPPATGLGREPQVTFRGSAVPHLDPMGTIPHRVRSHSIIHNPTV